MDNKQLLKYGSMISIILFAFLSILIGLYFLSQNTYSKENKNEIDVIYNMPMYDFSDWTSKQEKKFEDSRPFCGYFCTIISR